MAGFTRNEEEAGRLARLYLDGAPVTGRGAFTRGDTVTFRIRAPRNTCRAEMLFFSDDTGERFCFEMTAENATSFSASVPMSALCPDAQTGLFFYKYRVITEGGAFDIARRPSDLAECYIDVDEREGTFQLLVYKRRENLPSWFYGGVMYQVFPDRFFGAGENDFDKKNAVLCRDREAFPSHMRCREENHKNNLFYGGDLQGIAAKLDYLASLGVTCLYLNPIFASPSNHRYNTADYEHIDPLLGGEAAFDLLIREASSRGIRVILDGVFNHTGRDSVYFNAEGNYPTVGAAQSQDSPYYDWYSFTDYPDRYESWWGITTLPRVRSDHPAYRAFLFGENGVIRRWLRAGAAGWRLDVADELSDEFLRELAATAVREKPDALIIGEVWEDATDKISYDKRRQYLRGGALDSVMNYPVRAAVIDYLTQGDFMGLKRTLETIYGNYPPEAANATMNILGTHDTVRILTALGDEEIDSVPYNELAGRKMPDAMREKAIARLRLAVAIQMTLPGVPCIYYGDEAGMEGAGDPFCRLSFPWGDEDSALTDTYRKLAAARRREEIFRCGGFTLVHVDTDVLCYERIGETEKIVVLINVGGQEYEFRAESAAALLTGEKGNSFLISPESAALFKTPRNADYSVLVRFEQKENRI